MGFNRRQLILSGVSAGAVVASPALWAQSKTARKIVIGQSVPLTGAADQIGLAYLNGAKIYFDAINAKNGAGGYKIEVKALDDGYTPAKAAANAKLLIDEGVDALFGFTGTASCDAAFAAAKASGTLFFAPLPRPMRCTIPRSSAFSTCVPRWPMRPTKSRAIAPR